MAPNMSPEHIRAAFAGPLPDRPRGPRRGPDRRRSSGPRYFGLVIGGALLAASAAEVLTTGWDQAAYNKVLSPAAGAT